jgi:hypothetical protein
MTISPPRPDQGKELLVPSVLANDDELLEKLSETTDIDTLLHDFAFGRPNDDGDITSQKDLERVLRAFTDKLVQHASQDGHVDSQLVLRGFKLIVSKMNAEAVNKLGDGSSPLLRAVGYRRPEQHARRAVAGFTDLEWDRQFRLTCLNMKPQADPEKARDEIYGIFHDHALAPYSLLQQALGWA